MTTQEINPNFHLKLDPTSERYRTCLECAIPFMAFNLKSKFCCNKHRWEYNNRQRRLAKQKTCITPVNVSEIISPENNSTVPGDSETSHFDVYKMLGL